MGSTCLYSMWQKPLEPNGILIGYNISYAEVKGTKLAPDIAREPAITDPTETRAKLCKLESNTKYRITIRATTIMGEGVPYFIEATTNQLQVVPAKPTFTWFLMPVKDGRTSIKVFWLPDVDRHPGSHFFVQYKKKGETQWMRTADEEVIDNLVVEDLELGTLYEIRVVSVDGEFYTTSDTEEIETIGIALPPVIVEPSLPLYEVADGHNIVLSCRDFAAKKPMVKWIRGGKELTGKRFITLENGDLEIRNARSTDAAHYQCLAASNYGEARLQVTPAL